MRVVLLSMGKGISASDKKTIPFIASMSVVLGFLISLAEYVMFL